jgi:hypothetical protein
MAEDVYEKLASRSQPRRDSCEQQVVSCMCSNISTEITRSNRPLPEAEGEGAKSFMSAVITLRFVSRLAIASDSISAAELELETAVMRLAG